MFMNSKSRIAMAVLVLAATRLGGCGGGNRGYNGGASLGLAPNVLPTDGTRGRSVPTPGSSLLEIDSLALCPVWLTPLVLASPAIR